MKRGVNKGGGKIVKVADLVPEPPPPPPPKLTKVQELNATSVALNETWERLKASLPPHTKADTNRAQHLLAPSVWGTADMQCTKCVGACYRLTGSYQSCNYVKEFKVGTGKLEKLQCDFIWWLLFIGQAEGLSIEGLTLKAEFDIIPPEMEEKIEKIKGSKKLSFEEKNMRVDALTERYESYLHEIRDWLISEQLVSEGSKDYGCNF